MLLFSKSIKKLKSLNLKANPLKHKTKKLQKIMDKQIWYLKKWIFIFLLK